VIRIEIVYAQTLKSAVKCVELAQGAMICDALEVAASDPAFLGVDLANSAVGVFGKIVPRDQILNDGDRVEIYRQLVEEPKLARRKRVNKPGRS
jgi:putative ubiquitin-RnfH superfamily antitoxin RatB of RatAB toxin-antitoxin module